MNKITILLIGLLICGCDDTSVENKLFESISSPSKSFKAVVFQRTAGATTGFNRQVAILESNEPFAKSDKIESFFCIKGEAKIEVVWLSETNILVRYPLWQQIIRTNSQVGKISVVYEAH